MQIQSAKDLTVYKKAYQLAMEIFEISKTFPAEERYALISQIRRSSRSISMNLREAWAKRRYEAHFISKLTDCDGENSETDTSLDFARDCNYINDKQHDHLTGLCKEVGKILAQCSETPRRSCLRNSSAEIRDQKSNVKKMLRTILRLTLRPLTSDL